MTHDGMSLCHALHAQREDGRDDGRQAFGHSRDRQGHSQEEDIEERRHAAHLLDENDRDDHHDCDDDHSYCEHSAHSIELLL